MICPLQMPLHRFHSQLRAQNVLLVEPASRHIERSIPGNANDLLAPDMFVAQLQRALVSLKQFGRLLGTSSGAATHNDELAPT
jgi:hypothetical protein